MNCSFVAGTSVCNIVLFGNLLIQHISLWHGLASKSQAKMQCFAWCHRVTALTLHSAHSMDHSFGLRHACSTGQSTCKTDLPLLEKALIMPSETVQMPLVYVGKHSIGMCIDTSCSATNPVYILSHITRHGLFFDTSMLLRVLTNRVQPDIF